MRVTRWVLGAAGVTMVLVGVWHLLGTRLSDLPGVLVFAAGGVLAHDLVLAPLVALGGALLVRVLPPSWRAPVVVGLVVLLSATLVAVPVLGRFGAKPDDPGLLPLPYLRHWLLLGGVVAAGVVAAAGVTAGVARRRARRP